ESKRARVRMVLVFDKTPMVLSAPAAWAYRRSRPPIPTDRDHLFRMIATSSEARVLTAPASYAGAVMIGAITEAVELLGAILVVSKQVARHDERTRRSLHLHRRDRNRLRPLAVVRRPAADHRTFSPRRAHRDHRGCYLPDY